MMYVVVDVDVMFEWWCVCVVDGCKRLCVWCDVVLMCVNEMMMMM